MKKIIKVYYQGLRNKSTLLGHYPPPPNLLKNSKLRTGKVIFYLLVALSLSIACDKEKIKEEVKPVPVAKSDEAEILKWEFGNKEATISGTDIKITFPITLPFGTDITALIANAILSPKATISPNPTQSRDYTKPVKYTVTAENGTTQKQYTVLVKVAVRQGWDRTYGGGRDDEAKSLIQTKDGGYAMAGFKDKGFGAGGNDFWLIKVDSNGKEQWEKTYGGIRSDEAHSLIQTTDGGYAMAGFTGKGWGAGRDDFWLVKVDSNGEKQWDKTYGGSGNDKAYALIQTTDGGYAMAGFKDKGWAAGGNDFWLVKVDSNGKKQWDKTYGGANYDEAESLIQTADGGYAMAGFKDMGWGTGGRDFWLVKVDGNGKKQWDKTYGESGNDEANSLIQTTDGSYVLAGAYGYSSGANDSWLVKVDSNGKKQWDKKYGESSYDVFYSLIQTKDGGYAMAGFTDKGWETGGNDFRLVKVANNGKKQWDKTYGGSYYDGANSLIQTKDGSYVLAGYTGNKDSNDLWLLKVDSKGNL